MFTRKLIVTVVVVAYTLIGLWADGEMIKDAIKEGIALSETH
jgi:hypothetical protein